MVVPWHKQRSEEASLTLCTDRQHMALECCVWSMRVRKTPSRQQPPIGHIASEAGLPWGNRQFYVDLPLSEVYSHNYPQKRHASAR